MSSCLFRGSLSHHRGGAVQNNFTYRLYTACLDLDELDELDRELRLFSLEGKNVFALRGVDYALAEGKTRPSQRRPDGRSLKERALERFASADIAGEPRRIELVTQLRVFDHVFNPVSFFLAYDADDALLGVVAEINNTYDETFSYILDDRCRRAARGDAVFTTDKQFFVSPFIGDDCTYEWLFPDRREPSSIDIRMRLARPVGGRFFAARLRGERRFLSDRTLLGALLRFPAMPAQIWLRIHLQALRLRARGLQYRRPTP